MPLTTDIVRSYRRPGAVLRDHLARGTTEPRVLAFLIGGCLMVFVSQWPVLARQAHLEGTDLNPLLGGALMAWLFLAPLLLYAIAAVSQVAMRLAKARISGLAARLALFWALLASSPLILLNGLVEGFLGDGVELTIAGAIWVGVFLWFWISGLRAARAAEGGA